MSPTRALICLLLLAGGLLAAMPAHAYGDRVVPHVPDGIGGDGTAFRTKFDITNLGPLQETRIRNIRVLFFRQNGTPWTLATNLGNVSEINLDLGPYQTLRIETLGLSSPLTWGYAIIRNREGNSVFSEDFQVNISVFYEVLRGGRVIDTVSVSVGQPTVSWIFPAETDVGRDLLTGFAVVNLASQSNTLQLRMYEEIPPVSGSNAQPRETRSITLAPGEQRAIFLNDPSLFPNLTSFKGMLKGLSTAPVSILALLQSPTPTGVQYATMVPSYMDALRRNAAIYLRETLPLDADLPLSDYFNNKEDRIPWDLLYEATGTLRQLTPQQGAQFAVIGTRTWEEFDQITVSFLEGLTYGSNPIGSDRFSVDFAFAIRTGLGRYAKVRIDDVVSQGDQRHLVLEVYVYR
jgi:hypothetical protein